MFIYIYIFVMALAFFSMGIFWFDIYKLKIIDDSISTCSLLFTRIARRSHHGNRGCFITSKCDAGYCLLTVRVAHKGNSFFVVVGCWLIVIMNHTTVRETFMLHASKCMNPLLLCSFVSHHILNFDIEAKLSYFLIINAWICILYWNSCFT